MGGTCAGGDSDLGVVDETSLRRIWEIGGLGVCMNSVR